MSDHCKEVALTAWSDKFLEHGRNIPFPAAAEMRHGEGREESWKGSAKNQGQLWKATNRTFFSLKEKEVTALICSRCMEKTMLLLFLQWPGPCTNSDHVPLGTANQIQGPRHQKPLPDCCCLTHLPTSWPCSLKPDQPVQLHRPSPSTDCLQLSSAAQTQTTASLACYLLIQSPKSSFHWYSLGPGDLFVLHATTRTNVFCHFILQTEKL